MPQILVPDPSVECRFSGSVMKHSAGARCAFDQLWYVASRQVLEFDFLSSALSKTVLLLQRCGNSKFRIYSSNVSKPLLYVTVIYYNQTVNKINQVS